MNNKEDIEMHGLTDGEKAKEQNIRYLKHGEGEGGSKGVIGNVIVNKDSPIKTNSHSHRGHDSFFVP